MECFPCYHQELVTILTFCHLSVAKNKEEWYINDRDLSKQLYNHPTIFLSLEWKKDEDRSQTKEKYNCLNMEEKMALQRPYLIIHSRTFAIDSSDSLDFTICLSLDFADLPFVFTKDLVFKSETHSATSQGVSFLSKGGVMLFQLVQSVRWLQDTPGGLRTCIYILCSYGEKKKYNTNSCLLRRIQKG